MRLKKTSQRFYHEDKIVVSISHLNLQFLNSEAEDRSHLSNK